ncbi:MAG: alpha/beta fold hydrolase [Candidatus Dormibacteria bacterium]|jgi:hypothetical protein
MTSTTHGGTSQSELSPIRASGLFPSRAGLHVGEAYRSCQAKEVAGLLGSVLLAHPCRTLPPPGHIDRHAPHPDTGHSTHLADAPVPDLQAALLGDLSSASYTLSDVAADTAGLLDVLGLDSTHVVGASLGGMIAQTMAIDHPGRVRSLASMISTTGDRNVGQARRHTMEHQEPSRGSEPLGSPRPSGMALPLSTRSVGVTASEVDASA